MWCVADMQRFCLVIILSLCFSCQHFQNLFSNSEVELDNLTLIGYQGWFGTPNDGSGGRWRHWSRDPKGVKPKNVIFELYPDTSEYPLDSLVTTDLGPLGNGQPSRLFSSADPAVVDKHFEWLSTYQLDGIVLQRFMSNRDDPTLLGFREKVTRNVKASSAKWRKPFYLMYDISGASEQFDQHIKDDFENQIVKKIDLMSSPLYVRKNRKPVIGLWGLGFAGRPGTPEQTLKLVRWFQSKGFYVVGGVSFYWREEGKAAKKGWHDVYHGLDRILPWSVSAIQTLPEVEKLYADVVAKDAAYCEGRGIDYQVVLYPGFAWSNWNKGKRNFIPRLGGKFMTRQAEEAKKLNLGAFVAMFDEYDESTAIAKAATSSLLIPQRQYFLTLDADGEALPSDHYLKLTSRLTRFLRSKP